MIPIVLFAAAFVVRAAVGLTFPGPAYPDSYYYAHVGERLASGLGLTVDYVWNLDDIGTSLANGLPVAANALWMPLAEVIQAPFIWLMGPTGLATAMPFWIVGALAAPLTWFIGRDAGFDARPALAASLMVAVPGGLTPFMSQPDNFGLFMTLGALALWLCALGARGDRRAFVLGGLVVGLATLTRSDGVLLGIPFAIVGVRELVRRMRGREVMLSAAAVVGCAALFAIVMVPWMYRQMEVFGSFLPSASNGRLIWLTDYQQLFSIANPPTVAAWLDQGIGAIVASRLGGLVSSLGLFALLPLAVVLAPFALIGGWTRRHDSAFIPLFVYAVALFAVMALVFPVLVPHGTFIHAASALVPHTFLLVVAGIGSAVGWVARRRPTWNGARATVVFSYGAVVLVVLAAAIQTTSTLEELGTGPCGSGKRCAGTPGNTGRGSSHGRRPRRVQLPGRSTGHRHSQRSAAGDRGHDARLRGPLAGPRAGSDRARARAGVRGRCPSVMALPAGRGRSGPAIRCDRSGHLRRLPDRR